MCSTSLLPNASRCTDNVVRLEDGEKGGLFARTIARRLATLSGLYGYLLARDLVPTSPVSTGLGVRLPASRQRPGRAAPLIRAPRTLPRVLDVADAARLLDALRTQRDRAMVPELDCGIEHNLLHVMNISQGFDLRIDSSIPFLENLEGGPLTRMWLRPFAADEDQPDTVLYFALMAGDITPPVTMNRGHFGWTPTVQLTTYLRHRPAPGWLRAIASSRVVGETRFEEDHLIFDANGQVVVQSRQLAMLPKNVWSAIDN
jgi:hypothetical protein